MRVADLELYASYYGPVMGLLQYCWQRVCLGVVTAADSGPASPGRAAQAAQFSLFAGQAKTRQMHGTFTAWHLTAGEG